MKTGKTHLKLGIIKMLALGLIAVIGLIACKSPQTVLQQEKSEQTTIIRERLHPVQGLKIANSFTLQFDTLKTDTSQTLTIRDTTFQFNNERIESKLKIKGNKIEQELNILPLLIKLADTTKTTKNETTKTIEKEKNKLTLENKIIIGFYSFLFLIFLLTIKKYTK